MAASLRPGVPVAIRLFIIGSLWLLPDMARACMACFSDSPFHPGLILGTLLLIPLPGLIAWALVRAARKAEQESHKND